MSLSKETWGNNIWYLFHSLAHKIREDKFESQKNNIIFIIKTICNTLPCPDCSKDATSMLNRVDFNAINTKLNKPHFSYESLDAKYNNVNIDALYNNLYVIYAINTHIPQLMSSNFHKNLSFPKIQEALNALKNDLQ
jgi:hypothetical protein